MVLVGSIVFIGILWTGTTEKIRLWQEKPCKYVGNKIKLHLTNRSLYIETTTGVYRINNIRSGKIPKRIFVKKTHNGGYFLCHYKL